MTKTDFLRSLDFENAKITIARKLNIKPDTLSVKVTKNGVFEIDLKNANNPTGALVHNAKKAILAVTRVDIGEATDKDGKPNGVFAYNADITVIIKNNEMEYVAKVGELDFVKNKLIFSTNAEIIEQELNAKAKYKVDKDTTKNKNIKKQSQTNKKTSVTKSKK